MISLITWNSPAVTHSTWWYAALFIAAGFPATAFNTGLITGAQDASPPVGQSSRARARGCRRGAGARRRHSHPRDARRVSPAARSAQRSSQLLPGLRRHCRRRTPRAGKLDAAEATPSSTARAKPPRLKARGPRPGRGPRSGASPPRRGRTRVAARQPAPERFRPRAARHAPETWFDAVERIMRVYGSWSLTNGRCVGCDRRQEAARDHRVPCRSSPTGGRARPGTANH